MDLIYALRQFNKPNAMFDEFFGKGNWNVVIDKLVMDKIGELVEPYSEEELNDIIEKYVRTEPPQEPNEDAINIPSRVYLEKIPDPRVRAYFLGS